jgi:CRISPR/Cas system-associated exonuclease Cas4 (RecB family)
MQNNIEFPNIPTVMDEHKFSKIDVWPVRSNRASQMGDSCLRKLVYYRTSWDKILPHSVDLQYIFDEGNEQETSLTIELQEALRKKGMKFIAQQQAIKIEGTEISGRIDGKIVHKKQIFPTDIKSCNPNIWDRLNKTEDFNKYPWTKKYPAQLLIYMYADNLEGGMFLLKNKSTGKLKQFNLVLSDWLEQVEEVLQKDKKIREYIKSGTLPEKINDPEMCKGCPFEHICMPSLNYDGISFEDNPELEEKLKRITEIKPIVAEYTSLEKQINPMVKGKEFNCGNFLIQGKWISKTYPAQLEERQSKYWKKSITVLERKLTK